MFNFNVAITKMESTLIIFDRENSENVEYSRSFEYVEKNSMIAFIMKFYCNELNFIGTKINLSATFAALTYSL